MMEADGDRIGIMTDTKDAPVQVAALQYCAAGTAAETLPFLLPMITRAAEDLSLIHI